MLRFLTICLCNQSFLCTSCSCESNQTWLLFSSLCFSPSSSSPRCHQNVFILRYMLMCTMCLLAWPVQLPVLQCTGAVKEAVDVLGSPSLIVLLSPPPLFLGGDGGGGGWVGVGGIVYLKSLHIRLILQLQHVSPNCTNCN